MKGYYSDGSANLVLHCFCMKNTVFTIDTCCVLKLNSKIDAGGITVNKTNFTL